MADLSKRPDLRRCNLDAFIAMAKDHRGVTEADARNVWMRLVEVVRGARYTLHSAAAETLTYAQFITVVKGGQEQFRGMSYERWNLAQKVATRLQETLASRTGDAMHTHEELHRFIQGRGGDTRQATRIWTILLRDGLGIGAVYDEAEKRLFAVPESVILMIADSDPNVHRNLGVGLVQTLRDWCSTF